MTQAPSLESLMAQVADEFLDRQARGESPGVEEYAERYPQIAGFIRQMFPTLAVLRGGAGDDPDSDDGPRRLGDFRIVREVGRGGMGVVYEAEQLSLGRRVALKVLPFASALDRRQLARFRTEAQAAGQLHHTHIVPVYFVGDDRGVHFFAMQFIDGRTVADLIADLRRETEPPPVGETTPAQNALSTLRSSRRPEYFRWVAECGVQAAEALEHAHSQGVVHRDVKPANLIRDHAGQVWVTDFGLAQVRSDVRLTATGDVVGTLRYMSPEQALRPAQVDHRTDVYSLGVTLYEMLTLQPAFPGEGREELLRQLADREPRSARAADRTIPVELDVIVRKAMAKEPDERYPTARELAADLQRFLDNLPILARRPSLWQHARKWSHRHRQIVTTAVAGVILALTGTTVALLAKNKELGRAITEKQTAEATAVREAEIARGARDRADANFGDFLQVVDRMMEIVAAGLNLTREELLVGQRICQEFLRLREGLAAETAHAPGVRLLEARALTFDAHVWFSLGDGGRGDWSLHQAFELYRELVAVHPHGPDYLEAFGWALGREGLRQIEGGRAGPGNALLEQGFVHLERALAAAPNHADARYHYYDLIFMTVSAREAGTGVRPAARRADGQAIATRLAADFPDNALYAFGRLRYELFEADRLFLGGKKAAAEPEYVRHCVELRRLVERRPDQTIFRTFLVRYLSRLAISREDRRDYGGAEAAYAEAVAHGEVLRTRNPASHFAHLEYAMAACYWGIMVGRTDAGVRRAVDLLGPGVRSARLAVELDPKNTAYRYALLRWTASLAGFTMLSGKPVEAGALLAGAADLDVVNPQDWFQSAEILCLCTGRIAADPTIPAGRKAGLTEYLHGYALDMLRKAVRQGLPNRDRIRRSKPLAVLAGPALEEILNAPAAGPATPGPGAK